MKSLSLTLYCGLDSEEHLVIFDVSGRADDGDESKPTVMTRDQLLADLDILRVAAIDIESRATGSRLAVTIRRIIRHLVSVYDPLGTTPQERSAS
jgi:hypothetical protein